MLIRWKILAVQIINIYQTDFLSEILSQIDEYNQGNLK